MGIAIVNVVALPKLTKKEPRSVSVTVRLSKIAAMQLKTLANGHNMSQADVIEHLLQQEFKEYARKNGKLVVEMLK